MDIEGGAVARTNAGHLLKDDGIEVEESRVGVRGIVLGRELQQVGDDVLHLTTGCQQGTRQGRDLHPIGVSECDLEVGAHRRQRALQVVRRVRHERTLAASAALQPAEHPVHGSREPADLVVDTALVDATPQVGLVDGRHGRGDPVDTAQGRAEHGPDGQGEQAEDEGYADEQRPSKGGRRLGHRLQAATDEHGHVAVGRRPPPGPDPVALGLVVVRCVERGDHQLVPGDIEGSNAQHGRSPGDVGGRRQHVSIGSDDLRERLVVDVAQLSVGGQITTLGGRQQVAHPRLGQVVTGAGQLTFQGPG